MWYVRTPFTVVCYRSGIPVFLPSVLLCAGDTVAIWDNLGFANEQERWLPAGKALFQKEIL